MCVRAEAGEIQRRGSWKYFSMIYKADQAVFYWNIIPWDCFHDNDGNTSLQLVCDHCKHMKTLVLIVGSLCTVNADTYWKDCKTTVQQMWETENTHKKNHPLCIDWTFTVICTKAAATLKVSCSTFPSCLTLTCWASCRLSVFLHTHRKFWGHVVLLLGPGVLWKSSSPSHHHWGGEEVYRGKHWRHGSTFSNG